MYDSNFSDQLKTHDDSLFNDKFFEGIFKDNFGIIFRGTVRFVLFVLYIGFLLIFLELLLSALDLSLTRSIDFFIETGLLYYILAFLLFRFYFSEVTLQKEKEKEIDIFNTELKDYISDQSPDEERTSVSIKKIIRNINRLERKNLPLKKAYLEAADLKRAYLFKADLEEAVFVGANLSGANMVSASLKEANFNKAKLPHANLESVYGPGATFTEADLSHANLKKTRFWGVHGGYNGGLTDGFIDTNFSKANLSNAQLAGAILYKADFSEANLAEANLSGTNLGWANLSGANLSRANLFQAIIVGANLEGANIAGANLSGMVIGYRYSGVPGGRDRESDDYHTWLGENFFNDKKINFKGRFMDYKKIKFLGLLMANKLIGVEEVLKKYEIHEVSVRLNPYTYAPHFFERILKDYPKDDHWGHELLPRAYVLKLTGEEVTPENKTDKRLAQALKRHQQLRGEGSQLP